MDNKSGKLTVKDWDKEMQPRERLIKYGVRALSNHELLAILLRTGIKGKTVVDLSIEIMKNCDEKLTRLQRMTVQDMQTAFKAIGEAKAVTVCASMELGRRLAMEHVSQKEEDIIRSSNDLYSQFSPVLNDLPHEEVWAVCMTPRNKVIERYRVAEGGIDSSMVDPRKVFAPALIHKATLIAIAHNHPTGNLTPSTEDDRLTRRIKEGARILGLTLLDHLILGNTDFRASASTNGDDNNGWLDCSSQRYFSYSDEDRLNHLS